MPRLDLSLNQARALHELLLKDCPPELGDFHRNMIIPLQMEILQTRINDSLKELDRLGFYAFNQSGQVVSRVSIGEIKVKELDYGQS